MSDVVSFIVSKYNFWGYIVLMLIGLYAMIAKNNLAKKIIGMNIFQTAVIFFYISIATKRNASIPIIQHGHGHHAGVQEAIQAVDYMNPLPHVLMLTAIVVSVATLGVALALAIKVFRHFNTFEEDEILEQLRKR